jgi:acetoin:2,6-dichlorophenolindophenol oxidoreductase subunit alpha
MSLSDEILLELYYGMKQTRLFEETAARLFSLGKVHGTAHFCVGEEAVGIGVGRALQKEDYILQTHRGHGQAIGKGMDIKEMMAEFLGKKTGCCKGYGGCMHIADFSVGSLGANGIVGGGLSLAVGAALSQQYQGKQQVTVCFFGDGATNQGIFHESLNLASVWKLPVIFVCTNNLYGMSTHVSKAMNIDDISIRAVSYNIPGSTFDGNDVISVYTETRKAREYVLANGPVLMVLNTYRWMGHSKSDSQVYRTREEVEEWKRRDPIKRLRETLLGERGIPQKRLDALDAAAADEIDQALAYAEMSPEPLLDELASDVYAD